MLVPSMNDMPHLMHKNIMIRSKKEFTIPAAKNFPTPIAKSAVSLHILRQPSPLEMMNRIRIRRLHYDFRIRILSTKIVTWEKNHPLIASEFRDLICQSNPIDLYCQTCNQRCIRRHVHAAIRLQKMAAIILF